MTPSTTLTTKRSRVATSRFGRSPTIFDSQDQRRRWSSTDFEEPIRRATTIGDLQNFRPTKRLAARIARSINLWHALLVALLMLSLPRTANAQRFATGGPYNTPAGQSPTAELLRDVRIEQHLDAPLPLDTEFQDELGKSVKLRDYFRDKPVVLALVQYRCPMLCTQVLNGFSRTSQAIPLELGRDYQFVAISFDSREGSELAAEKKRHYSRVYRRPGAETGMHFLTGDQASIDALTKAIGFHYQYVERTDQFAHASGIVIATPNGHLSRYLYGIEYAPHDLRLGLVESSHGAIGTPADQVLLLCYHYDPLTGTYGLAISNVIRWAGILTIMIVGSFLVRMIRLERSRPKLVRSLINADLDTPRPPVLSQLREQP